jgi:hypothetical protein
MYRQGRAPVPDFDPGELLYLRYKCEHWVDGQLDPAGLHLPRTSVNRSRFSEPEDALFSEAGKYNGLGVVRFWVSEIPPRIEQQHGPAYVFFMTHVPDEENYSHSEIWSDHEPREGGCREPSKTAKMRFRVVLCQRIRQDRVCIEAVL